MGKRILHVTGFGHNTRARDLAHAFERYGRLVRCDIPGARRESKPIPFANPCAGIPDNRFAFVEYEESRDAADAFDRMHDQYVGDHRIGVQWAKRPPARSWRFDGGDERGAPSGDRARSSRRSRSRSPSYRSRGGDRSSRRSGRSRSRSRSSRSPARDDRRSNGRGYDDRRAAPSSSRRPPSESRSPSRHARRRDESAGRPAPRDRSPGSRRSYSRSPSRSRSPRAKPSAPAMDVDALRPADEPTSAHDDAADHHDDLED
ncbi:hypothetical protein H4R27_002290 [Coemansia aciculifera]|nr:hypothetical protein H4R27_002290 [Coemansia aciculifera]